MAKEFPAVVLTGARQTGKTTLLRMCFPEHHYVALDRPLDAEMAESDPDAFFALHPPPLILDEVQHAPGVFRHVKRIIDGRRREKGLFLLTGSQKFTLMGAVAESLAGRVGVLALEGLSLHEICQAEPLPTWFALLSRGGFPELWAEAGRSGRDFLQSYVATYLERDVRQISAIGSLRDFERFLRACALRTGQLLNRSELARDVGISVPTATQWLGILEASNQVRLLEPWFGNVGKRLVKTPKLYVADPALANLFLGIREEDLSTSPSTGALFETFIFAELRKRLEAAGSSATLWFYRDQAQREVDFVVETGHALSLVECKWTATPSGADARRLKLVSEVFAAARARRHQVRQRIIISRAREAFRLADGTEVRSPWHGDLVGDGV